VAPDTDAIDGHADHAPAVIAAPQTPGPLAVLPPATPARAGSSEVSLMLPMIRLHPQDTVCRRMTQEKR
jgi:hypothetical protein